MGLIRNFGRAIGGAWSDSKEVEVLSCEDLGNDILMKIVRTEDGVIKNGSKVYVKPGQAAMVFDSGKLIDATSEEGTYVFDGSTPSLWHGGNFWDRLKGVGREIADRTKFGGDSSRQTFVLFFNTKEITKNKFGTATPVVFQDWSHPTHNSITNTFSPMRVDVRCYGTYTFRIENIMLFMNRVAGTAEVYTKNDVADQIKSEVISVLQNLFNELGNSSHKVPVLELPSQTDEIMQLMRERVFDQEIRNRGLQLISFAIESVSLEADSQKKIDEYELRTSTHLQQGRIAEAYANALEGAANNANGAAAGFIGVGMMNGFNAGMMGTNMFQNPGMNNQQMNPQMNQQQPQMAGVVTNMQVQNENQVEEKREYKFCSKCGKQVPVDAVFCQYCGYKFEQ